MLQRSFSLAIAAFLITASPGQAADAEGTWLKGNTHAHSFWSDGNDFPEMIADWYREAGYQFLGISDHNVLQRGDKWVAEATIAKRQRGLGKSALQKYRARFGGDWIESRERDGGGVEYRLKTLEEYRGEFEEEGKFLLLEAEEISNNVPPFSVHVNAVNLDRVIPAQTGGTARELLRKSLQAASEEEKRSGRPVLAHLNHPNFRWAISAEDLAHVLEERFFEVYNGHPIINHNGDGIRPGDEAIWDIANTLRLSRLNAPPLYGVATDDSHTYHGGDVSPGRGWIMVRASELSAAALIEAMRAGDFYASSGVVLEKLEFDPEEGVLRILIEGDGDATFTTEIIGTERGFDENVEEIAASEKYPHAVRYRYSKDVGAVLSRLEGREIEYRLTGNEFYIRATITSSEPHPNPSFEGQHKQAWTQPVGWEIE